MTDIRSAVADPSEGRKLTVAFAVTSLHGGGAEFVGRTWMAWLVSQGHRVVAITTSAKPTDDYLPAGVGLRSVGGAAGHLSRIQLLRRLLAELSPDVAVGMASYPNLLLIAAARTMRRRRPQVVVSERNLVSLGLAGAGPMHRVRHKIATRAYRTADHVIAISHPVAGELVSGFRVPGRKLSIVPNPATAKVVEAGRLDRADIDDIDVELVVATRLVAQKRPEHAVRVARALADRGVRVKLTYFGTGPLEGALARLAERLSVDLELRGWAENWFAECSRHAVFVLTSDREGFGNVLVEAAAAGVPSVALSNALGVADAVVPGLTGELALDDRPETIAAAVQRAMAIGAVTGVERWLDRFSYQRSGEALESVLSRVVREARGE